MVQEKRDAERREQLIFNRPYDQKNYGGDGLGLAYFSGVPVALVRQLVAEGLLDLRYCHNESPSVEEMLEFCSGAGKDTYRSRCTRPKIRNRLIYALAAQFDG